jgi:hypothetical protein
MNKNILSFSAMILITFSGYLIGKFADIGSEYYTPFILWFIALCIFNMFLDEKHVNVYLTTIKPS